ncbi:MAG: ribose-5-phosphate isomerase RpiA [Thaumarchaeota archaeon]|nr:ribose-5-phosphate isomerase RpiA [Nitrososphaerota archaeon]
MFSWCVESSLEDALAKIAELAVKHVSGGEVIGLGSGATVARFVEKLGAYSSGLRESVMVIASSSQIQLVAERVGLELASPSLVPNISLAVDGADQIDARFNMIKGGGGALLREEVLLHAARKRIILADEEKYVDVLSKPVPVEFVSFARTGVEKELREIGGKPSLRVLNKGYPYVTENGNFIFDTDFGPIKKPEQSTVQIKNIPGVTASGIFIGAGDIFYVARRDGSVERLAASP